MQVSEFTELEAPAFFDSEKEAGAVVLGRVLFRVDRRSVVLALEDRRRRHLYVVGKTGMGKTTLIQNLIVADMRAGRGICLIDPHGDLADSVVGLVPLIRDPIVRSFWVHEFAGWSDNYRTEAVAAIQNKLRPFLNSTNIRAIVSQPGRSLYLRDVMDRGQVLI